MHQKDFVPIQEVRHYHATVNEAAAAEDAIRDALGDQPVPKSEAVVRADITPLTPYLTQMAELGFTIATGLITNAMYDVLKPKALALLDHLRHDKQIDRKTRVDIRVGDYTSLIAMARHYLKPDNLGVDFVNLAEFIVPGEVLRAIKQPTGN